jgi:hypothetical protein
LYNTFSKAKVFGISKDYGVPLERIANYCKKKTEKTLRDFDSVRFLRDMWLEIPDKDMPIYDKLKAEYEFLGYINYINPELALNYFICSTEKRGNNTLLSCYNLSNGNPLYFKIKIAYEKTQRPLEAGDVIRVINAREDFKWKYNKEEGKCYQTDEKEWVLTEWLRLNGN